MTKKATRTRKTATTTTTETSSPTTLFRFRLKTRLHRPSAVQEDLPGKAAVAAAEEEEAAAEDEAEGAVLFPKLLLRNPAAARSARASNPAPQTTSPWAAASPCSGRKTRPGSTA